MGKDEQPRKFEINGRPVKCPACGNEMFYEREVFLGQYKVFNDHFDVTNRTCSECGYIMLFDPYPGAP